MAWRLLNPILMHSKNAIVWTFAMCACGHNEGTTIDAVAARDTAVDSAAVPFGQLDLIVGEANGQVANAPADWPQAAGPWNGKAARFDPVHRMIAFETTRLDITGGQIDASTTDPNGGVYFTSGPGGGTLSPTGTSVLYVANADGTSPRCLGCTDVVDSTDGVEIYKVALSTGGPATPQRQPPGTRIDANRNKDLPYWDTTGGWIIAGIELTKHAFAHSTGNSEVGGWVDLWAISPDGKTWVQLTDFAATWTTTNPTSGRPLQCAEAACIAACQGVVATNTHPFGEYACSAAAAPPPTVGVMRPIVSHGLGGSIAGSAKIAWSERVGWNGSYTWKGPQQVATGDLVMVPVAGKMLPAIASYERNLTPTEDLPAGRGLWAAAGANVIGRGYETWGFSPDDSRLLIAADSCLYADKLSRSKPAWQSLAGSSEAFVDITSWDFRVASPAYADLTSYDAVAYPYAPNGASSGVSTLGHWEEPVVISATATPFMAFATSANLTPAWDPSSSATTFALEVWIMPVDRSAAATQITHLSDANTRFLTYPTAIDQDILYITSAPQQGVASNAPGVTYRYRVAP